MSDRPGDRTSCRDDLEQKEIVRKGYDALSYAYRSDDASVEHGDYAEWVDYLKARLPAGAPVLDVGCGCGLPATKLLAETFDVTGVDFSEVQIDRARKLTFVTMRTPRRSKSLRSAQSSRTVQPSMSEPARPMAYR
ncbi:methyltransferase domain-containing protein [Planctomycetota bacterium]